MGRVDWTKGFWNFIFTGFALDRLEFLMTTILDIESFDISYMFQTFQTSLYKKNLKKKESGHRDMLGTIIVLKKLI